MLRNFSKLVLTYPVLSALFIVVTPLAVSVFLIKSQDPTITNYPSNGNEVVVFGDSLVAGVGATEGNGLVPELEQLLSTSIVNLGVSGNTTADGLARINTLPSSPKMVIIILGGNDVLRKVPATQVHQNIRAIVTEAQARGAVVALGSVKSSFLGEGLLTDEYEQIAEDTGSIFLGNVLDEIFGDDNLMSDRIHPNDQGYQIMAERIAKKMGPYLQ